MDEDTLTLLLEIAAGLIGVAAVAAVVALNLQKRQKLVSTRIDGISDLYARGDTLTEAHRSARRQTTSKPMLHHLARAFGYNPSRAEDYPMRWYFVLSLSLLAARIGAVVVTPLLGWIGLALVAPATLLISRSVYASFVGKRKKALYIQFPDALAMIVRGVRVGVPVAESMRTVAREAQPPTAGEFLRVADRVALGVPLEEALYEMAERNEISEYRFFATTIGLQSQTGGGLTEALEGLGEVIRKRVALRARGYALASEARTSIFILCALPVVTGLALMVVNPTYISQLFTTAIGQKVFAAAVLSFAIGLTVMQQIVRRSLA